MKYLIYMMRKIINYFKKRITLFNAYRFGKEIGRNHGYMITHGYSLFNFDRKIVSEYEVRKSIDDGWLAGFRIFCDTATGCEEW